MITADAILNSVTELIVQSFFGAIITGSLFALLGTLVWRFLVGRVETSSPARAGGAAKIAHAVKVPGYALLLLMGVKLFLILAPAFRTKGAWIQGTTMVTTFGVAVLLGESLFAFFIDYYMQERRGTGIPTIFKQLLKAIVYLIIGLSFLSTTYKIDITPLLTTSAVFTMVIGLALQDVLGNLFAGISVHISPPFKIGDWITLDTFFGKVVESNWRATTLVAPNLDLIVIPNNDISKKDVINHSVSPGVIRREFTIGLGYETSPEQARRNLLGACTQVKNIATVPSPQVYMEGFGDSSITYRVRYWIAESAEQLRIQDQLASRIWYRLKREGMVIPFPIRDIYMHPEKDLNDQLVSRKLSLISEIDFLKNLDRKHLAFIAQHLKEFWFEEGEVIVRRGETGTDFFILDQGQVSVFLDDSLSSRVAVLKEREFFGEMSLLTGEPRSATIYADVETKVLILKQEVISQILTENPGLATVLSEALSARHAANVARKEREDQKFPRSRKPGGEEDVTSQASSILLDRIRQFFRLR